ncbi:MAG: hypothetical protein PWP73_1149, partial [Methanococcus sp.]|nr:hypothetical protein [Methanococcus sp.]
KYVKYSRVMIFLIYIFNVNIKKNWLMKDILKNLKKESIILRQFQVQALKHFYFSNKACNQ